MSVGKYRAYLILRELDPDITAEEVQGMTMREIYQLIQSHAQEEGGTSGSLPELSGGGHGHGHHRWAQ